MQRIHVDLPDPEGAQHDDHLALLDRGRHPLQGLEVAVPLVDTITDDHVVACGQLFGDGNGCVVDAHGFYLSPTPRFFSRRWEYLDMA